MLRRPLLLALALCTGAVPAAGAQAVQFPTGEARRLDSLGTLQWLDYERVSHRAQVWADRNPSLIKPPRGAKMQFEDTLMAYAEERFSFIPRNKQAAALRRTAAPYDTPLGGAPYKAALQFFRDAARADSTNRIIRRHVYRALAAESQWQVLLGEARRAAARDPGDAELRLAEGLALHRLERYVAADTAFRAALERMTPAERGPYQSLSRLLVPNQYANRQPMPDSLQFAALTAADQERVARLYWDRRDPRPSTPVNEARLEYLARLTYANLRWSSDSGLPGIDSDRGDIHVRFGPPEAIFGTGAGQAWIYRDNSIFYFGNGPTYQSARMAQAERRTLEDSILIENPAGWTGMPLVLRTSPMLARVARFRATADSADAVAVAAIPVRSMLGETDLGGALPIKVHLDVHDPRSQLVGVEERRVSVVRDRLPFSINGTWVRRLGAGLNVVRIDAEQPDVERGAVARTDVLVDSLTGFGVSDILFGTMNPGETVTAPTRWRDVKIAPTIGAFPTTQPIGIVWENYELQARDGKVEYAVTLELERTFKNNLTGLSARIARNFVNLVTRTGSATGRVAVEFNEARPTAAVTTNALTIDLRGSVTGPYRLHIEVKDLHTGRIARRSADFELVPDGE